MNFLDAIADFVLKIGGWFFSWFGDNDKVKEVQEKVVAMCGFLPTAASVAAMLSAGNPTVTGVIGIATAICQAVRDKRSAGLSLIAAKVGWGMVNGVPVEGEFITGK